MISYQNFYSNLFENKAFSEMTHHDFDQLNTGWRKFGKNYKASIQAILQFVKQKGWGKDEPGHVLRWHLFQLYALENMTNEAKKLLQDIIKSGEWDDYYSRGTLAWMNGDAKSLKKEISDALADKEYMKNMKPNIKILVKMLKGIGKNYSEVY